LISVERRLAVVSLVLLMSGFGALLSAYFPRWDKTPETPTWIMAGPMDKIEWSESEVLFSIDLTTKHILIDYFLKPKETGIYHLDIWTPYDVQPSALPEGIKQTTSQLEDGTYWVSVNATLEANKETLITAQGEVQDIYSAHEPGKDTVVITLSGGMLSKDAARIASDRARINEEGIFVLVRRFLVIMQFSSDAVLSSDTFPPPISTYVLGRFRWAEWLLNFTNPIWNNGQSISISLLSRANIMSRDLLLFFSGILMATGTGGGFELVLDHYRGKRSSNRSAAREHAVQTAGRAP
jgi:hypothetical protein